MAIKSTAFAKVGKLNLNPIVRFNELCLKDTDIKVSDQVRIEYHGNKIVIRKVV